jgi:SCY1-like protein 1
LKSVLVIIPKLSDRTINGDLLKQLAKTANDEQPGIRTNTTICLGKIAKNLGTSSRSKVLTAAFSRSLRDPFVHARNAALLALGATADYFTDEDCANKILPVVCPLLMDKEKIVRDSANRTMDVYLQKIRKAAADLPETALPPPSAPGATTGTPRMGTPQPQANEPAGWAGWAISSFTNKLSSAAGEMQAANGSGVTSPVPSQSSLPSRPPTSSASNLNRQAVASPPPDRSRGASPNPTSVAQAFLQEDDGDDGGDSWGNMGDFDEDEGAVTKTSTSSKRQVAAVANPAPFDDGTEPDFAEWLAAKAKKPGPSKPLPKGLSKASTTTTKKPATKPAVTKKIDLKPKETGDDDGWGDGW